MLPQAVCPPFNSQKWRCWHLGGLLKALGAPHTSQGSISCPPWDPPSHHHHLCAGCIISQQGPGSPPSQGGVCPQQPCVGISRRCVISLVSDIHLLTGSRSNHFWIISLSSYKAVLQQDASIHPSTFRNKSGKRTALLLPRGSLFSTDL